MRPIDRLRQRLAKRTVLLTGGLGTQLLREGHPTPLPLWSTATLLDAPEAIAALHAEYARAGADVVEANTFRTARATVAPHRLDARALTLQAVALARDAVAAAGSHAAVAGSTGPVGDCYRPDKVPDDATLRSEHAQHARLLAEAGVDLVMVETMNTIREATAALGAARDEGLPAMVSFVVDDATRLLSGETLDQAIAAIEPFEPLAILVNCCAPKTATAAVASLARLTTRPFGAYANGVGRPDDDQGWCFEGGYDDAYYVEQARTWLAHGARVIGGCCGTSPDTIRALTALDSRR